MFVYIDESGEIGRKSKYIVFASITTDTPRSLEKAMKKVWKAKPQLHHHGELHANLVDDATRKRVLLTIAELEVTMHYKVIDKSVHANLAKQYYVELADFITKHPNAKIIIVDKKDTDKYRTKIVNQLGLTEVFANVEFEQSHKVKQLQAVDFIAWAVGRFYELDDATFKDFINIKKLT